MNPAIWSLILNLLGVLLIVAIIAAIWFVFWTAIKYPINMKDAILKERDDARLELLEIQAAKGVEWDKYKELEEENDKLRKAYFSTKEKVESLNSEVAKLKVDKDNLVNYNNELKKKKPANNT